MQNSTGYVASLCVLLPMVSQATPQWSGCVSVIGVSNYIAANASVVLAVSPGIPSCAANGIPGAIQFANGYNGVSVTNISSFLASGLASQVSGQQVMVYYDSSNCTGFVISNGGYAGQC